MTRRYISDRDADATAADIDRIYRWAIHHWDNPQPLHLPITTTDPPAPLLHCNTCTCQLHQPATRHQRPPVPRLHCDTCTDTFPITAADQLHHHTRHTHHRAPTRHERTPRT